jgi:hypothetical protein
MAARERVRARMRRALLVVLRDHVVVVSARLGCRFIRRPWHIVALEDVGRRQNRNTTPARASHW